MRISKTFVFDSAHRLPGYLGPCANLHGHRWELEVSTDGVIAPIGMVMDFNHLSKCVKESVIDKFDHHYLNDILPMPTAELLLWKIGDLLIEGGMLLWSELKLWESPGSCAILTRQEYDEGLETWQPEGSIM